MDAKTARTLNVRALVAANDGPAGFGRMIQRAPTQVSQWISETNPKPIGHALARHIEECAGLPSGSLDVFSFSGSKPRVTVHAYKIRATEGEDGADPETDVMVPVYDIEVAGGPGAVLPEFVETKYRLPFQTAWLNDWDASEEDIMVARVRGSSMEPVLYDGDKVVIHTKRKRIRNECVYSLIYGGEARVKRLFNLADGSLRIVSDNPDKNRYPDELVPAADRDQVFILGQVIDKMGNGGLGF